MEAKDTLGESRKTALEGQVNLSKGQRQPGDKTSQVLARPKPQQEPMFVGARTAIPLVVGSLPIPQNHALLLQPCVLYIGIFQGKERNSTQREPGWV